MESGNVAHPVERDRIQQWMGTFDEHVGARVMLARETAPGRVLGPLLSTADLLMAPAAQVPELFDCLRRVVRNTPPGTELLWLLETGTDATGPGPEELRALFSAWMRVVSVDLSQPPGRAVVIARVRRHAVSFVLDLTRPQNEDGLAEMLRGLQVSRAGVARARGGFVVLDRQHVRALSRSSRRMLLAAIGDAWLAPVAKIDTSLCTNDELAKTLHRLRKTLPGNGDLLRCVTFVGEDPLNEPTAVVDAVYSNGIECLFELYSSAVAGNVFTRLQGSYLRYGSYYPLRFDRRIPRVTGSAKGPIAVVGRDRSRGLTTVEDWALFWETRNAANPDRFVSRADYKRREKLMSSFARAPSHGQFFHDFFFHNWRVHEPDTNTTLVNLGLQSDPRTVVNTVARAVDFFESWNDRDVLVTPSDFIECARKEAVERSLTSVASGLDLQRDEHDYLGAVDDRSGGELSPVERDFLEFIPADCGVALEIGGGYGRLGGALKGRVRTYVNAELHSRYLRPTGPESYGILGDFHKLPFRDETFDVIIANNVLEHSYQPLGALLELKRILVNGGALLAVIPLDAMNAEYNISTHFWKADELSVMRACQAAGLLTRRLEVVDINALGMIESYPTCNGLCVKVEAVKSV